MVDGSGNGYLHTVCDYVHLNPVRAKLLAGAARERLRWSSYPEYLKARPASGMAAGGPVAGRTWDSAGHGLGGRQFALHLEQRRGQERGGDWKASDAAGVWGMKRFARNCWRK